MGRKRTSRQLDIWMNGQLAGHWIVGSKAEQEFRYASSWIESEAARPLSLSLPLQPNHYAHKGMVVESFFDNLLPDSEDIRRRIQINFSAESLKAFDLLAQIGKDCVGAVQLLEPGQKPIHINKILGRIITPKEIENILLNQTARIAPGTSFNEAFRISLAGAQEKTAFLRHHDKWMIPQASTPTTHIFKLPLGRVGMEKADLSTSVENEWLCIQIARAYGLETADCSLYKFHSSKVLVVKRFDRKMAHNKKWWIRLPLEDMCQALGVSPLFKYESQGGPGIKSIMELLLGSSLAAQDRINFFKTQVIFWILAAPDGHAKNFSIFLEPGGTFRLAPLYDIISAHPILGRTKNKIAPQKLRMAMYLLGKNRHDQWNGISRHHFESTGLKCGLSLNIINRVLSEIRDRTDEVISCVYRQLPRDFPDIADIIFSGLRSGARRLGVG